MRRMCSCMRYHDPFWIPRLKHTLPIILPGSHDMDICLQGAHLA
jgi:hypothetical protein